MLTAHDDYPHEDRVLAEVRRRVRRRERWRRWTGLVQRAGEALALGALVGLALWIWILGFAQFARQITARWP